MSCQACEDVPFMRNRVTIQKPTVGATPDAAGHVDFTNGDANWTDVATRSCTIRTRGGSESFRFHQVHAQVTHLVDMRSDATTRTIQPYWRLKFGSRYFDIRAAYDVDQSKMTVRCECTEAV